MNFIIDHLILNSSSQYEIVAKLENQFVFNELFK